MERDIQALRHTHIVSSGLSTPCWDGTHTRIASAARTPAATIPHLSTTLWQHLSPALWPLAPVVGWQRHQLCRLAAGSPAPRHVLLAVCRPGRLPASPVRVHTIVVSASYTPTVKPCAGPMHQGSDAYLQLVWCVDKVTTTWAYEHHELGSAQDTPDVLYQT